MTASPRAFSGAEIFDGAVRKIGHSLIVEGGAVSRIVPEAEVPFGIDITRFDGGLICPAFVDLQVNGGGGIMFNDNPSASTLKRIASAHATLGATSILPTLITDTPEKTRAAVDAVEAAIEGGVEGIIGLHLEGPHLSVARKGAHDPGLIRPMTPADLAFLLDAISRLPVLKITLAPESVSTRQIQTLEEAGAILSLGHSDASYDDCASAVLAGVGCVTHLFNAMSQLTNREPGVVGAALSFGELSAGLIADGVHVHPETIRAAFRAKVAPGRIFLVSDSMAVAGSNCQGFLLNDRKVTRTDGRLMLENGTLAGADLDLIRAVRNMVNWNIATEDQAIAMATSIPGQIVSRNGGLGSLKPGTKADFLHFACLAPSDFKTFRSGEVLSTAPTGSEV